MSLSLHIGLKALLGARTVLDTIGHNMANANTPGYSRQRVDLSAGVAVERGGRWVGSGVEAPDIRRTVDDLLTSRLVGQRGVLGSLESRLDGLTQIESFLGTGESSIGGLMDRMFSSVSELASGPSDGILRTGLIQSAQTLTARLNEVDANTVLSGKELDLELESLVSEVNRIASEVASLNVQVERAETGGTSANDLMDQRDQLVDELSKLVDVQTVRSSRGAVQVLVSGNLLVTSNKAVEMQKVRDASGDPRISIGNTDGFVPVAGGRIGGLLELQDSVVPEVRSGFDELARQLVLSFNRLHSTGMPADGPFSLLVGENELSDVDFDGEVRDELLSNAGLPFDVTNGSLFVNVEDVSSGDITRHEIEISSTHTTVQGFLDEVNGIDHLSAQLDANNRIRIVADGGYGFDFSKRVAPHPDVAGSFGSDVASLATPGPEPFALSDGDVLSITADPGGSPVSFDVTFPQSAFFEISEATAAEVAAVINADPNALANGIVAKDVGGNLVLQTLAGGPDADFTVDGGSAVNGLGWAGQVGTPITGHQNAVTPELSGVYTGDETRTLTFRPTSDGTIGTTPGLAVDVLDERGGVLATLDLGPDYVPGTELDLGDGLSVSFGLGELSASHGDVFETQLVSDPDTADALVALGLNGFFTGSTAADISIREDIATDPTRVATSISGEAGDSTLVLDLLELQSRPQSELGGTSLGQRYDEIAGKLGFRVASASGAYEANESVVESLELRREQTSGVDVDEELVDLVAFEQAFSAAARYISVVGQLSDEILALI